ncbi:hypothetical protein MMC13_007553 [Lambiella insularis]|nr:hypothetical protein [Lambiella insularis]
MEVLRSTYPGSQLGVAWSQHMMEIAAKSQGLGFANCATIYGYGIMNTDTSPLSMERIWALIRSSDLLSNGEDRRLGSIYEFTKGIVFLGTPHRGSGNTEYTGLVVSAARALLRDPNHQLLQTLSQNSHILERERRSFASISGSSKFSIACLYEELPWKNFGLIVPEDSAVIDSFGVKKVSIPANHEDMCNISAEISARNEMLEATILEMLTFSEMNRRKDEVEEAHRETFNWLLDDTLGKNDGISQSDENNYRIIDIDFPNEITRIEFITWLRAGHGIYWINGKAGAGKSTLLKFIRDDPRTHDYLRCWAGDNSLVIADFFFHDRGSTLEKSKIGLLKAVLYQVMASCPSVVSRVPPRPWKELERHHKITGGQKIDCAEITQGEIIKANKDLLASPIAGARFCLFIDGLDEYDGNDRDIAEVLISMIAPAFESAFRNCSSLRLQDLTRGDITMYVYDQLKLADYYLDTMNVIDAAKFHSLMEEIVSRASGVFIWVKFAVASLLDGLECYDAIGELETRVKALPLDLEAFYDRMLKKIESCYHTAAVRIFSIILNNEFSLTPVELTFVETDDWEILRCPINHFSKDQLLARRQRMEGRIKSKYGGLVEVHKSESKPGSHYWDYHVSFIHQTLREYFQESRSWDILCHSTTSSSLDFNVVPAVSAMLDFKEEFCSFNPANSSGLSSSIFYILEQLRDDPLVNLSSSIALIKALETDLQTLIDSSLPEQINEIVHYRNQTPRVGSNSYSRNPWADGFIVMPVLSNMVFYVRHEIEKGNVKASQRTKLGLPLLFYALALFRHHTKLNPEMLALLPENGAQVNERPTPPLKALTDPALLDAQVKKRPTPALKHLADPAILSIWKMNSPWEALLMSFSAWKHSVEIFEKVVGLFLEAGADISRLYEPLPHQAQSCISTLLQDKHNKPVLQILQKHGLKLHVDLRNEGTDSHSPSSCSQRTKRARIS